MGASDSTVSEYGTCSGNPLAPEAANTDVDSGAMDTCLGTTEPDGSPTEMVAVAVVVPGLASVKWTEEPDAVVSDSVVVWAKRQTVEASGAPSWRESPPVGPEPHCWNWGRPRFPTPALTRVATADAFWTKSPTFSTTNRPGGTTRPW